MIELKERRGTSIIDHLEEIVGIHPVEEGKHVIYGEGQNYVEFSTPGLQRRKRFMLNQIRMINEILQGRGELNE